VYFKQSVVYQGTFLALPMLCVGNKSLKVKLKVERWNCGNCNYLIIWTTVHC